MRSVARPLKQVASPLISAGCQYRADRRHATVDGGRRDRLAMFVIQCMKALGQFIVLLFGPGATPRYIDEGSV